MLIDIISCLASLLPFISIQICGLSLKLFLFNFFSAMTTAYTLYEAVMVSDMKIDGGKSNTLAI